LAVGEDRLEASLSCGPLFGQEGASKARFQRRLLVWTAATGVALSGLRLALPAADSPPQAAILAFDLAFCCCAALGAAVYCFATFTITRALRDLLASAGFGALSGAAALQALADLAGSAPSPHERIMTAGVLYASCAFWAASFSDKAWRPKSRAGSWAQLAAGWVLASAFPLIALRQAVDRIAFGEADASRAAGSAAYAAESLAVCVAVGLVIAAVVGNYRRCRTANEWMPGLECYFYITFAFAAFARAISSARFDAWWVCGQALFLESWLVFLGAAAIENAITHKEGRDRLQEMEALHEISWSLVGANNVRELLNLLADTVREKLGAKVVTVYLADETGEALEVAAISGPDTCLNSLGATYKAVSTDRQPGFHSGHTARAAKTKEVQVAADVSVDVEFVPWRTIAREDGCAVSLPLVDKGEAIGVLNLYFPDHQLLTRQKLKLLTTIAAAASPAIEIARASETPNRATGRFQLAA